MSNVPENELPDVGHFEFEVYGRGGRRSTRFQVRCDAIGLHENEMLLLSVIGPETSVKALTAGLRASGNEQKSVAYSVRIGNVEGTSSSEMPRGLPSPPLPT